MFRNSRFLSGKGGKRTSKGGDPDYEEIEISAQRNSKETTNELRSENAPHCDLCGATNATVRCDMCNNQAFCQACDETYHGHPRRATHSRKALVVATSTDKPQLPPKGSEGSVVSPPQPPPRKNKKGGILSSSFGRGSPEEESGRTLMGSLKKIMGNRPLPPTPAAVLDKRRSSVPNMNRNEARSNSAFNNKSLGSTMTVAIPQSIMELNSKAVAGKPPSSMPPPSMAQTQHLRSHHKGQAPLPIRKLSLQQLPNTFDDRRASMADSSPSATTPWDKPPIDTHKTRSQSVSDEQWNHMLAIQAVNPQKGYSGSAAASEVGDVSSARRGYNTMRDNPRTIGRGMVSSTSVCDLNTLAQQQQHPGPQMPQQPHPYPGMQSANSFQQLSLVNYDPNMMWVQAPPTPCALCQPPPQMYPPPIGPGGMKRTASNISMNLSSMGSDISGYPWAGSHAHHHMPMGYPGYYPGCHQHMGPPRCSQGSAMSIPDSMRSFTRMPHSPAPSGRSSSHRSHKSTKSRSFSTADNGGRKSRNHSRKRSEESDSESSSFSNHENFPAPLPKPGKPGGLAWQCDHCTFINPGHAQACGMCSKVPGRMNNRDTKSGNEYRRRHKRREKRADSMENVHMSDYDNHQRRGNRRQGHLPSSGSIKSSCGKSKKKSHRRGSSSLSSYSGSEAEEELQLEKQLRNLRLSSRSRAGDYDGLSVTSRTREKDRGTLKKEGDGRRYRNRRKCHSNRSMTPARSSASHPSRRTSIDSGDDEEGKYQESNKLDSYVSEHLPMKETKSSPSHEDTVIGTTASETNTLKNTNSKERTSSTRRRRKEKLMKSISSTSSSCSTTSGGSESSVSISSDGGETPEDSPIESREISPPVPLLSPKIKLNDISVKKSEIEAEVTKNVDNNYREDREKDMEKVYEEHQDDLVPEPNTILPVNKADTEEPPSFANTLDGIETLRTHEVVDYELGSQYINDGAIDTPEQMTKALEVLMPTLNYIEPQSPELEEKIIKLDYEIYDKPYVVEDQVKEDLPQISPVSPLIIQENEGIKAPKTILPSSQDPSYEVIDTPEKIANNQVMGKLNENIMKIQGRPVMKRNSPDKSASKESLVENIIMEGNNEKVIMKHIDQIKEVAQNIEPFSDKEDFIKMGTSSSENLNDNLSSTRERQQTPLSVSSSDAQFYSPPNSPVLSVNEKLRGKRNVTESQVYEEAGLSEDEQEEKVSQNSPPSLGTSLESVGEANDKVPFQDAISSDVVPLARSASDQDGDDKSEIPRSSSKRERVFTASDEEEIDERHLTVQQLITRRKQKAMKKDGMQLVKILREAEDLGYDPEEVSVAMLMGEKNKSPIEWLQENWRYMVDTVKTLASNYGFERKAKEIEEISAKEAKKALRLHKGDIWAAVTECIEEKQKKDKSQPDLSHDTEGDAEEEFTRANETTVTNLSHGTQSKIKERAESQPSDSDEYLNAISHLPSSPQDIQETENEIYANFVNPLLEKLEESLPRKSEGAPLISEELKKKIIQAILEGETEAATDDVVFDSDEESTIEELLAVAENPTFYDYFTAIDLEDFEEYSKCQAQGDEVPAEDESASSSYDSLGIPLGEDKEEEQLEEREEEEQIERREQDESGMEEREQEENGEELEEAKIPQGEETMSEFEYIEDFKSTESLVTEDPRENIITTTESNEDLQYIRQEDPALGTSDDPSNAESDEHMVTEEEESVAGAVTQSPQGSPTKRMQATQIVGFAIAKAMARETLVRGSSSPVSGGESPPRTPTPGSTSESETAPETSGPSATMESEEEYLRSLNTIPEEGSELTSKPISSPLESSTSASQTKSDPELLCTSVPPAVASFSGPIFIPSINQTPALHNSYYNTRHTYYNDEPIVLKEEKQELLSAEYESIAQGHTHRVSTTESHESAASLTGPSLLDGTELRHKESATTEEITKISKKTSKKKEKTSEKLKSGHSSTQTHPSMGSSMKENQTTVKQQQLKKVAKQSSKSPPSSSSESTLKKSKPVASPISPGIPESKAEAATSSISKAPKTKPKSRKLAAMTKGLKQSKSTKESSEESEEEKAAKEITRVEGLKSLQGQDTNYEEVQELKEQIQIMRRELESQIDTEDTSDKSVTSGEEPNSPSPPDQISIDGTEQECREEQQKPLSEEEVDDGDGDEDEDEEEEKTTGITDQDIEQYEQLKFDRTVRRLLAEGHTTSYERGEVAAHLLNLSFDETDSIQAAEGCSSLYTALQFLQQECELCAEKYPIGKMVSMLHCTHRCCYECANTYFSFQVKTKNIRELRCPFCNEPDLDESEEIAAEYLNNLDILLKNILDQEMHELFQRKLRDWTLMKDPNFRWCNKCSSGFIANPRARKLVCPDCKDVTCAQCRKQWEPAHVGITCEAFAKWKEENDPEMQAESVAQHLAENGITCPNCRYTYSLAKGGCMHFTCTECKYEFCSGCSQPFKQGAKCPVGPYCERLGLHAHHPRNCLFYLRDKEPGQLQQLLKEHSIEFDTEPPSGAENPKRLCQVQEQKETTEGLRDDICGRLTQKGSAGLCRLHYIEYLVEKINNHGLDPVSIFDEADLRVCLRRNGKTVPIRRWESEKLYRDKLIKLIKEQLPLT